jgi:hypothetical protein
MDTLDEPGDCWTWAQFNAFVDSLCPLESKRIFGQMNADGSSVYYRRAIRQAALDLANFIPEFCKNHETLYYNQDFAEDSEASVGALPPLAAVESAWYCNMDRLQRFPVMQVPWERRFELTEKRRDPFNYRSEFFVATATSIAAGEIIALLNGQTRPQRIGLMAVSPKHDQFYLFPKIKCEWIFSLFWDGQKLDYRDDEHVPFEEEAAQAVAWWVQAQFANYIERDAQRGQVFMLQYTNKRSNIYTRTKEKGLLIK